MLSTVQYAGQVMASYWYYDYQGKKYLGSVNYPESTGEWYDLLVVWHDGDDFVGRMCGVNRPDPVNGKIVENFYEYNYGRVMSQKFYGERQTAYLYNRSLGEFRSTVGTRPPFIYRYNPKGKVTSLTDPMNQVATFSYDDPLNPLKETRSVDPKGNATQFSYDTKGNLLTVTDALNNVTSFQYHEVFNKPTLITSPAPFNYTTQLLYDNSGNLLRVTNTLGKNTLYERDIYGQATKVTDELGRFSQMTYDTFGNVLTATNPLGKTTSYTWDNRGNPLRIDYPVPGTYVRAQYNLLNQLTRIYEPYDGQECNSATFIYYQGMLSLVYDLGNGGGIPSRAKKYEYGKGQLTKTIEDPWGTPLTTEMTCDPVYRTLTNVNRANNLSLPPDPRYEFLAEERGK